MSQRTDAHEIAAAKISEKSFDMLGRAQR